MVLAPAQAALADKPEPPAGAQLDAAPAVDLQNLPDALKAADALQATLSADQLAAARAVLDSYMPELQAIMALINPEKPSPDAEPQRVDPGLAARMVAVLDGIDAGLASVLDADQMALYRAVAMPDLSSAPPAPDGTVPELAAPSAVDAVEGYTSYCWYSPYYGAYAKYYSYYGYIYAYYQYYYYYTSTYSYLAYYYAYYSYWYSRYALDYSAPGYFGGYYTGMVSVEDGYTYFYWAYYWSYYGYLYGYYAYYYAWYHYYYEYSGGYAYYSYYYNYYGYDYGWSAYVYAYYCYYYW
jgi:hypothetical protein